MRCHGFLLPTFLVLMVGCKEVGEVDDEGCERLSVHDDISRGSGWWGDVCNWKNARLLLGCLSLLIRVLPSAFFSCALAVNIIGLLFLRQCFMGLTSSTET